MKFNLLILNYFFSIDYIFKAVYSIIIEVNFVLAQITAKNFFALFYIYNFDKI